MEHRSKIQSNLNTLKSLTKKLNHLDHVKWHRRCKSLTFNRQIQEVPVPKETSNLLKRIL